MTEIGGEVLSTFDPENIKGRLYETAAPLLARGSKVLARTGQQPVRLTRFGVLVSEGVSAANAVPEAGAKPAGQASFTRQPVNSFKLVHQKRVTDEFLEYDEEAQLGVFEEVVAEQADAIARGIDVTLLHGTNPATGELIGADGDTNVSAWITQNATVSPVDAAEADAFVAAFKDAALSINSGRSGRVDGALFAPEIWTELTDAKDEHGNQYAPNFDYSGNDSTYKGIPVAQTQTVPYNYDAEARPSAEGEETGHLAVVGDFSSVAVGIDFERPRVIEYGDPDGLGDLSRHNQVTIRTEAKVRFYIPRPEAFAVVAVAAGNGEEG